MTVDTTHLHVREATRADLEMIVAFNAALAAETEHKTLDLQVLKRGVERALADRNRGLYFIAEFDRTVVGQTLVTFEWSDWRAAWFWWLQSVYVRPEFRGRGVFKALYRHIQERCRAEPDTCGLRLYVEKSNRRALETYLRLGLAQAPYAMLEVDWSTAAR